MTKRDRIKNKRLPEGVTTCLSVTSFLLARVKRIMPAAKTHILTRHFEQFVSLSFSPHFASPFCRMRSQPLAYMLQGTHSGALEKSSGNGDGGKSTACKLGVLHSTSSNNRRRRARLGRHGRRDGTDRRGNRRDDGGRGGRWRRSN